MRLDCSEKYGDLKENLKTWAWELYPTPNILSCGNQRTGTKIPRWRVVILSGTKIPETLRSVVVEKIDSLGQLEVLILLFPAVKAV